MYKYEGTLLSLAPVSGLAATVAVIILIACPTASARADPGTLYVALGGD